jgi:multidrug transporter EmrE-like cation transporter
MSMSYVIVYIAAVNIPALHESASIYGVIGIACIVSGVGFLSLGEKRTGL